MNTHLSEILLLGILGMALCLVLGWWNPSPLWHPVSFLALEHGGESSLASLALLRERRALSSSKPLTMEGNSGVASCPETTLNTRLNVKTIKNSF